MNAVLKGLSASSGMGRGRAVLLPSIMTAVPRMEVAPDRREAEVARLGDALDRSVLQLEQVSGRPGLPEDLRQIFEAQILLVRDPMILADVERHIQAEGRNAEYAVALSLEDFRRKLAILDNQLIRERASDLEDIENRILCNLLEIPEGDVRIPILRNLAPDAVLIADEVSPSLMLHVRQAAGIAVQRGGVTGHMAILARSRGIPALVSVEGLLAQASAGDDVLVDAEQGELVVRPDPDRVAAFESFASRVAPVHEIQPSFTLADSDQAFLYANLDEPEEATSGEMTAVQGVGLFRSEFIYIRNPGLFFMDEEHAATYVEILKALPNTELTFRLLDIGDDKTFDSSFYNVVNLHQQSLRSLRGTQFLLANQHLLRSQLRAILTALARVKAETGYRTQLCRLMLPMIGARDEVRAVGRILDEMLNDPVLELKGLERPSLGIMLETPAACVMADRLAEDCDFFSLGTNDLAACMFGTDRLFSSRHENLLYQPALFRLLHQTIESLRATGRYADRVARTTVCGEIAAVPALLQIMVGLGLRKFSVARSGLAGSAAALRALELPRAQELARQVLRLGDEEELRQLAGCNPC